MNRDTEAIEAIRRGDTERYGELVERYQRLVYGIAWSRLGDANLCEEAVQETFVQGFRFLGGLRKPDKFPAWIARIARNMAQAIGRGRRRELSRQERWSLDELPSPAAAHAEDEPVGETLGHALSALPDAHRESLVLYYLQGNSVREAAALLGISEGAFKVRLHRARGKLREAMEERLEKSLQDLSPRKGLRDRILAVVPAFPIGWGAGAGGLAALLPAVGFALALAPGIAYQWYLYCRVAENFHEQGGFRQARFRRSLIKGSVFAMLMFVGPTLILRTWGLHAFFWGLRAVFGVLAVCLLPGIVGAARMLRVNRSRSILAGFLVTCAMEAAMVAFAFLGASLAWFFLAMLAFWIAMWWTFKDVPPRADYSLFLRAAHAGLGEADENGTLQLAPGREELRRFARFLGERLLAVGYSMRGAGRGDECIIYSPPLTVGLLHLPAPFSGESTILVRADGTCTAHVSDRDLRELQALDAGRQLNARGLESRVAGVVRAALSRFLAGDTAGAHALVQAEPDEAVFKQRLNRLPSWRVSYVLAVLATLFFFLVYLLWMPRGY